MPISKNEKTKLHPNFFYKFRQYLSDQVFGCTISQGKASQLYGLNDQTWRRLEFGKLSTPKETFIRANRAVIAGIIPVVDGVPDEQAINVRRHISETKKQPIPAIPATVNASLALESLAFTASDLDLPDFPVEILLVDDEEFDRIAADMAGKRRPRLRMADAA